MKFKPSGFRTLDHVESSLHISKINTLTLILLASNGFCTYAKKENDKDLLLAKFNEETDLLLLAWPGKWSQDIFRVMKKDLVKHYK